MDTMRLTIDIPLPDDIWEARPEFLARTAAPTNAFRLAMAEATGLEIGIKREIVSDAPLVAAKPPRKARTPRPVATAAEVAAITPEPVEPLDATGEQEPAAPIPHPRGRKAA